MAAEVLNRAMAAHRQGDLGKAERLYRELLKRPQAARDEAQALNALGCLCQQAGRPAEAERLIRKSLKRAPEQADFHANLARLLHALGRTREARQSYGAALERDPRRRDLWIEAGLLADALFDGPAALAALTKARSLGPPDPGLLNLMAQVQRREADPEAAAGLYREALALRPGEPDLLLGLGLAEKDASRYDRAAEALRQAVARAAGRSDLQEELGHVLLLAGREAEALAIAEGLAAEPDRVGKDETAVAVAGRLFQLAGEAGRAEALFRAQIAAHPRSLVARTALADLLRDAGQLSEARALAREALALKADLPDAELVLGQAALESGDLAEARRHMERAASLAPQSAATASNLVALETYDPAVGEAGLARAAAGWQKRFEAPLAFAREATRARAEGGGFDPERRLRIGYVSPDFRRHSVAFFIEPLLAAHDRSDFEIFCYAELGRPDAVSRRLAGLADIWRETAGQGDRQVAAGVRRDRIDILVDLAGHTSGNRLLTFALKPAPLQLTWLGYPGTTGLESIDYRLTDALADPPGEAERHHSENLVRLPGGFLCYRPPVEAPPVGPLPAAGNDTVTFGSFNLPAKIGPEVLACWAGILTALPESRLLLKGRGLGDPARRETLLARFAELGVAEDRLEIRGLLPDLAEHLGLYGRVDIALDSFPYNGTTTSFEALWMGVPVLSLAGKRHAGRVGASILAGIGLGELLASDLAGYRDLALALAKDREWLAALRAGLRDRLRASPFLDEAGFARKFEGACRDLWRRLCAERQPDG